MPRNRIKLNRFLSAILMKLRNIFVPRVLSYTRGIINVLKLQFLITILNAHNAQTVYKTSKTT